MFTNFWFWFVVVMLVCQVYNWSPVGRDSTDEQGWFGKRSGLSLYVDRATGVQYVKAGLFGRTTVRVDADGNPYLGD